MGLWPFVSGTLAIILLFFGGLALWSIAAPLASGTIAPGRLVVSGKRIVVQHLEGGIVADVLVKEGDRVTAGDLLVRLDETRARAERDMVRGRLAALTAELARLRTERDAAPDMAVPPDLEDLLDDSAAAKAIIAGQRRILNARRDHLATQARITDQRIAQLREEIVGLEAEIRAQDRQLVLITEEETALAQLVEKGLARRPQLLALQRASAEIAGATAQNRAAVARAGQAIGEAQFTLEDTRAGFLKEVVVGIREAETETADLVERLRTTEDILARSRILAPVAGTLVDLRGFTRGGVLGPADPVLDIVPDDRRLVVEARISPSDVENVGPGLKAEVRLTGFRMDEIPAIFGTVETISADALEDERTAETYYRAQIPFEPPAGWPDDIVLQPGMPAEVLIITGDRSAISYLTEPLARSLSRAWRER